PPELLLYSLPSARKDPALATSPLLPKAGPVWKIFQDASLPVKFSRGQCYVGGFIGSTASLINWLRPMIDSWVHGVNSLASIASRFLHSVYAGLVSCLAAEWQYLCNIVPDIGPLLAPIEDALRTKFLPAILGPDIKIDDDLRNLLTLGVKSRGLTIRNPTLTAESLFCTSQATTAYLSRSLLRNEPLSTHHNRAAVCSASASSRKECRDGETAFLQAILKRSPPKVKKRLERAGATCAWLSTIPDHFTGTELTKTEWLNNIALRYSSRPPHLPSHCDGCDEGFTVVHALNCKKGRLVGICHNNTRNEWAHLCRLAFSNARVKIKPLIHYGHDSSDRSPCCATTPPPPTSPNNIVGDEA
ncbi:hypothetical protein ACHAW6_000948, partial [Cyclotella cf. meneghiniana]